jgi:hypothetical protein
MHGVAGKKQIGISVIVQDVPSREATSCCKKPSPEDQVRERIERIDSGAGSEVDFLVLKRLQEALRKKKPCTPRMKNLMDMIEPVMKRFGYYF